MHILVIDGISTSQISHVSLPELAAHVSELAPQGTRISAVHCDKLVYTLKGSNFDCYDTTNNLDVATVDYVIMRGPNMELYYLSRFCAVHHIPLMNDFSLYYNGTKVAQTIVFYEEKVPFLSTIYAGDQELLIGQAGEVFGYPYILKSSIGTLGNSNYLIRDEEEAQSIIAKEPDVLFIAQEFCPNDCDYRLLIVGDEQLVIERRSTGDGHLNNTSKGAGASLANDVLPEEIIKAGRRLAKRIGLSVAGIDVIPNRDTGFYYFLEINTQPQLRSGALIEEKKKLFAHFLTHPVGGMGALTDL
jgi:glutathione synthase/RimK-type ligase-like ATP-grasp enzyme